MFIAMNRFQIVRGCEEEFERVWRTRDSHLKGVDGFIKFHLLRGPAAENYTLYASHSLWRNRSAFDAWTHSEAFRQAHSSAGSSRKLYLGHPKLERFESVLES